MSMTGERSELRPQMVKFPSILDLIQRRLSQKQEQNYANERQTNLTRDMLQALLQNNNRYSNKPLKRQQKHLKIPFPFVD